MGLCSDVLFPQNLVFMLQGSVEENIMELTKQKVGGAAGDDESLDPVAAQSRKTQAANLAGSLKSDKPNLKLEELDLLFKEPSLQLQPGQLVCL